MKEVGFYGKIKYREVERGPGDIIGEFIVGVDEGEGVLGMRYVKVLTIKVLNLFATDRVGISRNLCKLS